MDANDVAGGIANPSGEGIADIYSALRLNDPCIGRGFFKNSVCSTGGNTCIGTESNGQYACTGVRDIDYMNKARQSPSTLNWAKDVCGRSVHCLGYVYSEAIWDLYIRDLPRLYSFDSNTSLEMVQRLTYQGGGKVSSWYSTSKRDARSGFGGW